MIVCHCNRIDHRDIERACAELARAPMALLPTPATVYRVLDKRPRCGGCLPLAASVIYACGIEAGARPADCPFARGAEAEPAGAGAPGGAVAGEVILVAAE